MIEKKEKVPYNWQWENSITNGRYLEFDIAGDHPYKASRTNKSLSNHVDAVLQANQMNMNRHLDSKLQYDYLYRTIRKKFRKFKNRDDNEEIFDLVQEYYKYNDQKTHEALAVLSDEQLLIIRRKMDRGGIKS